MIKPVKKWGYCEYCFKHFKVSKFTPRYRKQRFCTNECRVKYHNSSEGKKRRNQEWEKKKAGRWAEGKIQCQICGRWYNVVTGHTRQLHGISADEYRKMFGIPKRNSLTSPSAHKNLTKKGNLKRLGKYAKKPGNR